MLESWSEESCYTLESLTVEIKTQLIPKLHNMDLFWVSGHSYASLIHILLIILKRSFQSSLRNCENKLTVRVTPHCSQPTSSSSFSLCNWKTKCGNENHPQRCSLHQCGSPFCAQQSWFSFKHVSLHVFMKCTCVHMWRSGDNFWRSFLSCHVDSEGQIQDILFGDKFLHLVSHLAEARLIGNVYNHF